MFGGVLFITEKSHFHIFSSNFSNAFSYYGAISFLRNSDESTFTYCRFINNTSINSLTDLTDSTLYVQNSFFQENYNIIFMAASSILIANSLNISNHSCNVQEMGCFLNSQEHSYIVFENINLNELQKTNKEGNIYAEISEIEIFNSNFSYLKSSEMMGTCIYIYASSLQINSTLFQYFDQNCIFSDLNCNITVNFSNFKNQNVPFNSSNRHGSIFCGNCINFMIFATFFSHQNSFNSGAGIFLETFKEHFSKIAVIMNCTFTHNEALQNGAALFASGINIIIKNNNFTSNKAGKGGAIYIDNHNGLLNLMTIFFLKIYFFREFPNGYTN